MTFFFLAPFLTAGTSSVSFCAVCCAEPSRLHKATRAKNAAVPKRSRLIMGGSVRRRKEGGAGFGRIDLDYGKVGLITIFASIISDFLPDLGASFCLARAGRYSGVSPGV